MDAFFMTIGRISPMIMEIYIFWCIPFMLMDGDHIDKNKSSSYKGNCVQLCGNPHMMSQ